MAVTQTCASGKGVLIVGGGQAGLQVAVSLRQGGYDGPVTIVAAEDRLPYQRPPLSKAYLKESQPFERLVLRPERFFSENAITLRRGESVSAIDRKSECVELLSGERLVYAHLVLATGARNRNLAVPGADRSGVHGLRTANDAERLRAAIGTARRLVVVGGGFIGLEVAATARANGTEVTVVEAADRLMGRVVSPAISDFFLAAHRAMGARVLLGEAALAITGTETADGVETASGHHPADLVLLAAGVVPNAELAEEAGLATERGILVDSFMTTGDPKIFAVGDCAVFESRHADGLVRLESVQNAVDQGKCVAARILGAGLPYDSVPWFWSDQGPYKLQIAGITSAADHVHAIGSPSEGRLVVFAFRGERLLGIETVNRPGDHMAGRKLLASDLRASRAEIEREDFDLKAHLQKLAAG
ncbi:MAG: FAD-dependent oxidoreductase [Rhizobiaceae bacterium]|nr:FAD-dependent oxidoreductase [Rhizobiaceae bacterium]